MKYSENRGNGFVLGLLCQKGFKQGKKAIRRGLGEAGRGGYPAWSMGLPACTLRGQTGMPVATYTFTRNALASRWLPGLFPEKTP